MFLDMIRERIAKEYRELIEQGMTRKAALIQISCRYNVHRTTIYRLCHRFKIPIS